MSTETVITIVAPTAGGIAPAIEKSVAETAKALGVENIRPDWLAEGQALDLILGTYHADLTAALRQKFQSVTGLDIFVQANDDFRKKRLLMADMDATMIEGETLDDLAGHLGIKDQVAPITAAAMRGEIDFEQALRQRVGLLRGMPVSALFESLEAVTFSKGAATLVKTMNRLGAKCVLISGGFDVFTRHVAATLGFYRNIGNTLGMDNDKLTGDVIPPIIDKIAKEKTLKEETGKLGLNPAQTMAVGDGANDIPMLQAAGAGVGYFGKPAVVAATPYQIRYTDLTALLYMQGYRKPQFTG